MTACPLDCFDSCQVVLKEETLFGGEDSYTHQSLCEHLNHYHKDKRLTHALLEGEEVSLDDAKQTLVRWLKECDPKKVLFYRGSGNVGRLQATTEIFFARFNATLTKGSLCDGAGQYGIKEGRGVNHLLSLEEIKKADVIVAWGRNIPVTNMHMMQIIKDKELIVIDPRETKLAKMADVYIPIKPRGDFYFAMLLARFALLEEMEDKAFINEYCENFSWYNDFIRSIRINAGLAKADVSPSHIYAVLERLKGKKVVFLVGTSVQKYSFGHSVVHAIDSFAALLGLFGKEGCGVNFLGDSMVGVTDVLRSDARRESRVNVDFSNYDLIVFQGSNALSQMPQTNHVEATLEGKKVVYFGLHDNETAKRANLVLPAQDFLVKEDVRFSYNDDRVLRMPKVKEPQTGISEYDLTNYLLGAFGLKSLASQEQLIASFLENTYAVEENVYRVDGREAVPYKKGFETEEKKFVFIEEVMDRFLVEDGYYMLITPKYSHALNSQFRRSEHVYLHPDLGFKEGESVLVESSIGEIRLSVRLDQGLRRDTVCIYANTPNVNRLTKNIISEEGENACFQEITVKVKHND